MRYKSMCFIFYFIVNQFCFTLEEFTKDQKYKEFTEKLNPTSELCKECIKISNDTMIQCLNTQLLSLNLQ